ncbi:MAG TPA: OmpW family outer membrane protein [Pseudoxanthomonas sp.]|nr:OmpW family outer membrane protein [Pseudoxanthomonas sp.]
MTALRPLGIALLSAIAFAPSAFAQDTTTGTAAGKRIAIVGGGALMEPDSDPLPGSRLDVDGTTATTLSASWYINDNVALELWGAVDKFNHRVRGDQGKIGTVDQQPIAISGQYHFGTGDSVIRPFVGLGYFESNFSNEDISAGGPYRSLSTAKGPIATAGVDFNINERWFARTDVRYMKSEADLNVRGNATGTTLDIDPWTVGVGVGVRF